MKGALGLGGEVGARVPAGVGLGFRWRRQISAWQLTLLLFCDRAGIDLPAAIRRKLRKNAANYPVEVVRGTSERPPRTVKKRTPRRR
jgi:hypothetical protein